MMKVSRLFLPLIIGTLMALVFLFGAGWQVADTARAAVPVQTDLQVAIRYVATTGSDTTDCTDSANPCATLQYAVDQAGVGDEVRVAGGEYTGVNNHGGLSQMVYISKTITVRGGYTVTNWMDSDPNLYPTTLDAQGQGRVIYISGLVSPTVEGLQITGGNAMGLGEKSPKGDSIGGGGIYVITSTAKIVNNEIISNTAGSGGGISVWESNSWIYSNTIVNNSGGGLALVSSTSIVQGNTISGNTSFSLGGGLLAGYSQLSIISNNITNNQADRGGGIYVGINSDGTSIIGNNISSNIGEDGGGGIYVDQSNVTISANTINSNTISSTGFVEHGGGIFISANAYTITQNTISYNMNNSDFTGVGGGVYVGYNSNGLFSKNMFVGNEAFRNGGGVYIESGGIISANHFISNTSDEYGGGLYIGSDSYIFGNHFETNSSHFGGGMFNAGSNTIENNVFTNNTAYLGGGLAVTAGENFIINNLIIQNEATVSGAGLLLFESTGHLIHNTLAQNVGGNAGLTIGGGFPSASAYITDTIIVSHTVGIFVGGSFFQDSAFLEATLWGNETNWAGPGIITTGTINFYGDPAFIDTANSDYHIGPNSIAIDSGINANISTDIDGDMRPVGAGFDIGADEFPFVIRYVAPTGSDTTNCTDSANPCATIQYAVDQAGVGDEVRVAGGEYTDLHVRPRRDNATTGVVTQIVYVTKTLEIRGGYTLANWINADPEVNPTILNAQSQGRGIYITGEISPTIDGLKITGGESAGLGGGYWSAVDAGGGIYSYEANVFVLNTEIFSNTSSTWDAAGFYGSFGNITLINNSIHHNLADRYAGGVLINEGKVEIVSNSIFQNSSLGNDGGMQLADVIATIDNSTIKENSASGYGGGFTVSGGELTLRNSSILSNTAGSIGGGAYIQYGEGIFTGNLIKGNSASGSGGGFVIGMSNLSFVNNQFVSNQSGTEGGSAFIAESVITATNNIFVKNQAQTGSAIFVSATELFLGHTTIAENFGEGSSALYIGPENKTYTNIHIANTIIVSQTVGISVASGNTVTLEATLWNNEINWIGSGTITTGTINLYGDPSFIDPANGDYHLNPDSIAIDAGIDAGVTTDIDGDTRPFGAGFDIGADEFVGVPALQVSKTANAQEIIAGDTLTYTLRITNTGTVPLHAWITDTLPGSVTPTGVLTWTALILPGEGWIQTVVVTSSSVFSGTLTNTVTVTTDEGASGTATALVTATMPPPPEFKQFLPLIRRP